jgi:hypothetical protein
MDPNLNGGGVNGQPPVAREPHATVVPMGEGWAPGVFPLAVAPRQRKLRWGVAGAVVLCVSLVTAAGVFVLSGAAGSKSLTASVAPRGTIAFLEVRTDLPGDQHAKLTDFMSHFPGFKDRGQFDTALDDVLNRLTSAVSPDLTYTSAFKPWMEGEVSIAVTNLGSVNMGMGMMSGSAVAGPTLLPLVVAPTPTDGSAPDAAATATDGLAPMVQPSFPVYSTNYTPPGAVAIFALKDRAAAESWLASELNKTGMTTTSQDYAGTKLYTFGSGVSADAYALTDHDLVLGTVAAVKASLDTKTQGSLADDANYQAAMGSISGDSLARFYVDPRAIVGYYIESYNSAMKSLGSLGGYPAMPTLAVSTSDVPAWIVGSVKAESNQMVLNVVMPRRSGTGQGNHTSTLASVLPGSTVAVTEVHSVGKVVTTELNALQTEMPGYSSLKSVKDGLGLIGGLDWLGDGAAVVTKDGSTYGGGIVAQATDAPTASSKVALVGNLIALGGGRFNLTSRDETYKGIDITVVTVPSNLISTVGSEEIAFAAKGNLIVAGLGDAFVKAVIDTTPSTSLASQSDYSIVMAAAGSSNEASVYVNIPALEDQIGQAVFGVSPSKWNLNYKPYFDHIGGVGYTVVDGNMVILRFIVTAK